MVFNVLVSCIAACGVELVPVELVSDDLVSAELVPQSRDGSVSAASNGLLNIRRLTSQEQNMVGGMLSTLHPSFDNLDAAHHVPPESASFTPMYVTDAVSLSDPIFGGGFRSDSRWFAVVLREDFDSESPDSIRRMQYIYVGEKGAAIRYNPPIPLEDTRYYTDRNHTLIDEIERFSEGRPLEKVSLDDLTLLGVEDPHDAIQSRTLTEQQFLAMAQNGFWSLTSGTPLGRFIDTPNLFEIAPMFWSAKENVAYHPPGSQLSKNDGRLVAFRYPHQKESELWQRLLRFVEAED